MKLIKANKPEVKALNEIFSVGDTIKYSGSFFDGRSYESYTRKMKVVKVNRVTIDAEDKNGNIYRLNEMDLRSTKKIIQEEVLA
jgi:hypothetical protein